MASIFLRPFILRPHTPILSLGLGLTFGLSLAAHHSFQTPIKLDNGSSAAAPIFSTDSYKANARTPVVRNGGLNPGAVRQISSGSVIGMLTGVEEGEANLKQVYVLVYL